MNIWGIEEYQGDGRSCPITPVHLPWPKKVFLFFFRFGLCPLCVTMSVGYCFVRAFRAILRGLGLQRTVLPGSQESKVGK